MTTKKQRRLARTGQLPTEWGGWAKLGLYNMAAFDPEAYWNKDVVNMLIRFWYWDEVFMELQTVIDDRYFEEWCWGALSEHCYFDPDAFTLDIKAYPTYYDVYLIRGHWYYESIQSS